MKNKYPIFKLGENKKVFDKFPKPQQKEINEFIEYCSLTLRSKSKREDVKRDITTFIYVLDKDYKKLGVKLPKDINGNNIPLQLFRKYLILLENSKRKSTIGTKAYSRKFLKWKFMDYPQRFNNFEDIKFKSEFNEERINNKTLLSKKDIEKIMKTEHRAYWKAFFILLYESGCRQQEIRDLKWEDVKFNE